MNHLSFRPSIRYSLISLIGVSLFAAGVVFAAQGAVPTEPGAIQAPDNANGVPNYDSATSKGLPPDDNRPVGNTRAPNAVMQAFHYYQVSGTTLRGRNSDTGYAYDGVGCSHVTVGTGTGRILNTELILPDDAVIKFLRVYYRDTNAANGVEGYITRYQPGVGTADLVHAGSSDAFVGGYGFVVSAEITEVVNNTVYAYTLIGWPDDANVNNQICGLRVAYYSPTTFTYLPTLVK
ncbi:MAG TPA: hypothetical protein VFF59_08050 [Anaerolineae bacterium]|nr:hypothetical protein [Anaerolineae bacterium]